MGENEMKPKPGLLQNVRLSEWLGKATRWDTFNKPRVFTSSLTFRFLRRTENVFAEHGAMNKLRLL